jgi:hypothetical protein
LVEPAGSSNDEQARAVAPHASGGSRGAPATLAALDPVEVRRDFVEVSMDLSRLVEALGPDVLFEIPEVFRGERNALPFRKLISSQAAMLPGFVSEVAHAAPLLHPAFPVEGSREREFVVGLRAVVREILLEPRTSATSKCSEDTKGTAEGRSLAQDAGEPHGTARVGSPG